jgi:hypothetical protein
VFTLRSGSHKKGASQEPPKEEHGGSPLPIAEGLINGERLSVMLCRLPPLAESEVHQANAGEHGCLPGPIPDSSEEGQRLTVVLQRLLRLA